MNLDRLDRKKKVLLLSLVAVPFIVAIVWAIYLKVAWSFIGPNGERFAPVENKPLFAGIIIFAIGYVFFVGMLFSGNIFELFNRRRSLGRR